MNSIAVSESSSGDQTILTGNEGQDIVVSGILLVATGAISITLKEGSSSLTGAMPLAANGGIGVFADELCRARNGANLVLNLGDDVAVNGLIQYRRVDSGV